MATIYGMMREMREAGSPRDKVYAVAMAGLALSWAMGLQGDAAFDRELRRLSAGPVVPL